MAKDPQGRRWCITINNPHDYGMTRDVILEKMYQFNARYFCMVDEIGEKGTYHTHIYLCSASPIRFSTLQHRFPTGHFEKANKSSYENREYHLKDGKWANTPKSKTTVPGTFYEFGEVPTEAEDESPGMYALIQCVEQGMSNAEIIRKKPSMALRLKGIDEVRDALQAERYMSENRKVIVNYLYGDSGTGKTRSIFA